MSRGTDLEIARELSRTGQMDDAYIIANRWLKSNPNDLPFITIMVYIMLASDKPAVAYSMARHAAQLAPNDSAVWVNMGMAAQDLWQSKEAERAYQKGIKVARDDEQRLMLMVNLCALYIDIGNFKEAEPWARKCIAINPEHQKAQANLGFCQLAQRNWKEGWKNYRVCIGHDWRPRVSYNDTPDWDGEKTGRVVLYAEQGLGDVISFASMVPDALKKADIVLDVNASLANLLQRSLPKAKVYGSRMAKKIDWDDIDREIDASLPIGQIGEYFRTTTESFPGTAYLKADPDRKYMWQQLFKKKKKPVIGIAWRGGTPKTAARYRQWDLEQLLPIFQSVDAHWVSLQYKSAKKEIAAFKENHPEIDLVEYPHATLTTDYDDTAAIVSALDHVICMQTAVGHLAGGLGIPTWTFVPMTSQWRYGQGYEDFVWCNSVRLVRQTKRGEWADDFKLVAGELSALFSGVQKTTDKPARKGKLRGDGRAVRGNSGKDHRSHGSGANA